MMYLPCRGLFALIAAAIVTGALLPGCAGGKQSRVDDAQRPDLAELPYAPRGEAVDDFGQYCPPHEMFRGVIHEPAESIERLTTRVPWPRGLTFMPDPETGAETLIALARGRHRSGGGVPQDFDDEAGTLFAVDITISEPVMHGETAGPAVQANARVLVRPVAPPFFPFDPTDETPEQNTLMTRPYCGLDYDPLSGNLIVCAFSGAELDGGRRFRKHATDSLLRFDWRDRTWRIVEQHNHERVPEEELGPVLCNTHYPHHDPAINDPPHGWLNGPTGCVVVGEYLYATSKDNHLVVQYDLGEIRRDPAASPPPSRPVLGPRVRFRLPEPRFSPTDCNPGEETVFNPGMESLSNGGFAKRTKEVLGAAAVAYSDGWLYVGSRTTSIVYRVPVDEHGNVVPDPVAELIAVFEPWRTDLGRSGNMFDMAFNSRGDLFVSMASSGRVWRITPDPANPFYADDMSDRSPVAEPFLDLTRLTGKRTSAGNIAIDSQDRLYICTRNNDTGDGPIDGVIYRVPTQPCE